MDETTTDVVPTEGGEQIEPQSDASPEGSEQDSPSGESQIEALSQQVANLSGIVSALQSDKDRRIPAIEKQLAAQAEELEKYHQRREAGQTHEQALREQALDELVASKLGDTEVPPKEEKATQPTVASADYLSPLLKVHGLDANDADVISILREHPNDAPGQIIALDRLIESRKQTTPANVAATMPSGGGQAVESESLDSVTKELQAEMLKPAGPEQRERIKELRKKQAELLPKE